MLTKHWSNHNINSTATHQQWKMSLNRHNNNHYNNSNNDTNLENTWIYSLNLHHLYNNSKKNNGNSSSIYKYTNLRKHEKRDPFANDGAGEDDEEGEDIGDQEHQLLETFHPFLGGLRSRIDFWRLNL